MNDGTNESYSNGSVVKLRERVDLLTDDLQLCKSEVKVIHLLMSDLAVEVAKLKVELKAATRHRSLSERIKDILAPETRKMLRRIFLRK